MTHTPGPWRVHSEHADRIIVNGCCVYQVRDMTTEEGFAGNGYGQPNPNDVRLMAAAPDLLAALRAAHDALDYAQAQVDSENDAHRLRQWRAQIGRVLAKAEGRTDDQ